MKQTTIALLPSLLFFVLKFLDSLSRSSGPSPPWQMSPSDTEAQDVSCAHTDTPMCMCHACVRTHTHNSIGRLCTKRIVKPNASFTYGLTSFSF